MAQKQWIIRNGYWAVVSDEKLATAEFDDYEYEHRMVAEDMLGRRLKEGEEVHHLDENKLNNSPDNLLVLSGPMHGKLHAWMEKNVIIPKPEYVQRIALGCVRCPTCQKPIDPEFKYCSPVCADHGRRKVERPSRDVLTEEFQSTSLVQLGKKYGVSDNAVRKWCKTYELL